MNNKVKLNKINSFSRYTLAFVFLYHGLVPKIFWLDSTEIFLVELHNLGFKAEYISLIGGIVEILLALFIITNKKSLAPIYISLILFIGLLIDVSIMQPSLLVKAFNPLTMNVMGISLCVLAIVSKNDAQN